MTSFSVIARQPRLQEYIVTRSSVTATTSQILNDIIETRADVAHSFATQRENSRIAYILDDENDVFVIINMYTRNGEVCASSYFQRGYKKFYTDSLEDFLIDFVKHNHGDGWEGLWCVSGTEETLSLDLSEDDVVDKYVIPSYYVPKDSSIKMIVKLNINPKVTHRFTIRPVEPVISVFSEKTFKVYVEGRETNEFDQIILDYGTFVNIPLPDKIYIMANELTLVVQYYVNGMRTSTITENRRGDLHHDLEFMYRHCVPKNTYFDVSAEMFLKFEERIWSSCQSIRRSVYRIASNDPQVLEGPLQETPDKVVEDLKHFIETNPDAAINVAFTYPKYSHVIDVVNVISRPN